MVVVVVVIVVMRIINRPSGTAAQFSSRLGARYSHGSVGRLAASTFSCSTWTGTKATSCYIVLGTGEISSAAEPDENLHFAGRAIHRPEQSCNRAPSSDQVPIGFGSRACCCPPRARARLPSACRDPPPRRRELIPIDHGLCLPEIVSRCPSPTHTHLPGGARKDPTAMP